MAIQHSAISDPQIHEPKNISTAAANTAYFSTGTGSGIWRQAGMADIDTPALYADLQSRLNGNLTSVTGRLFLTAVLADVSTASSIIIPLIQDCKVISASFVLGGPITTADSTVNIKNSSGASMGSPVQISHTSSAKGDQYSWLATGNNVIGGPSWIEIETNGASDNTVPLFILVEIEYILNENL